MSEFQKGARVASWDGRDLGRVRQIVVDDAEAATGDVLVEWADDRLAQVNEGLLLDRFTSQSGKYGRFF